MKNSNIRMIVSLSFNFILVLVSVVFIFQLASRGFAFGTQVFNEQPMDTLEHTRQVEVTITMDGASDDKVAELLYRKGLIEDKTVFRVQVILSDYRGKFQPGTYTLSTGMTPTEIIVQLCTATDEQNGTDGEKP